MKAEDLMVGDWVCLDGDVDYENPIQVQQIGYQGNNDIVADYDVYGIEDIHPILLTEDILMENGFEKLDDENFPTLFSWRLKPDDVSFWFWIDITQCATLADVYNSEFTYHDISITYVHQLQHLLRLCGVEKEIEL